MPFTNDEIQTAVEKLVVSSVRRPYATLGNRRTDITFSDFQDAASGVYILNQGASFYTVFLGTRRLIEFVDLEAETANNLLSAISEIDKRTTPISQLSPLANARVALESLEVASSGRSTPFENIEDVPAFKRFDLSSQRFLDDAGQNVKTNGDVVRTPDEARGLIPGLVNDLQDNHNETIRRVTALKDAISDFSSLNLPALASASVISKARQSLDARFNELEPLNEVGRLNAIRSVVLDILAARAAVRGFGSLSSPSTFLRLDGLGRPYSDADHVALEAALDSTIFGPYPIVDGANELDVTLDTDVFPGPPTAIIPIQGSFVATLEGTIAEPFDITASLNDQLDIQVDGFPLVSVTLAPFFSYPIESVVSDINSFIPLATPIIAEPYFNPRKFLGTVDIGISGPDTTFTFVAPNSWTALGVVDGDKIVVTDPTSANFNSVYTVNVFGVTTLVLTCTLVSGPPTTAELQKIIELGSPFRALRIRITGPNDAPKPDYRITALNLRTAISLPGTSTVKRNTAFLLGLAPLIRVVSRPTTADEAVFSVKTAASGAGRLRAESFFSPTIYTGLGRSEPTDSTKIVIFKKRATADMTGGSFVIFSVIGAGDAGVAIGDTAVIRTTPTTADINRQGVVTAVFTNAVSIAFSPFSVTAGSDIDIEIGPTLTGTPLEPVIRASGGSINDGDYIGLFQAPSPSFIPFEFTIERPLVEFAALGSNPSFFDVAVGQKAVRFFSTAQTTDSHIHIEDQAPNVNSAESLFFIGGIGNAAGSTQFFLLPEVPKGLEVGDMLELYETDYNIVSQSFEVVGIETELRVIQLSPSIQSDQASIQFSLSSTPPFARIRKKQRNTFASFQAGSEVWLARDENQPAFFTELERKLNPILINRNPTTSQVNDAKLQLQGLLKFLTKDGAISAGGDPNESIEGILEAYGANKVDSVDALIQAYTEKGSDRGVDTLLEGRFNDFFGLGQDQVSYAGTVLSSLKTVTREDLPIRKLDRHRKKAQETILASFEDKDFEFDQSDIDSVEVDIPGQSQKPFPGQAF